MSRRIVRCIIEMDMVEGEHFNTIGFDEEPIQYATDEQAHRWARNYMVEYLSDIITGVIPGLKVEDYIQTKILEEPS